MKTRFAAVLICAAIAAVFLGCSGTRFNIRTDPTDASVKVYSETGLKDKVLVLDPDDPLATKDIDRPQDLVQIIRRT